MLQWAHAQCAANTARTKTMLASQPPSLSPYPQRGAQLMQNSSIHTCNVCKLLFCNGSRPCSSWLLSPTLLWRFVWTLRLESVSNS